MGATVIATGRNERALARLVSSVVRTKDVNKDVASLQQHGVIDTFVEMTPIGA